MKYGESKFFFPVPKDSDDYMAGKGDYVREIKDEKGKFWLSKCVFADQEMSEEDIAHEKR